ncbi:MAG: hypothetical protein ACR2JS_04280 [Candidatus Nanopelagicales bacterium]
MGVPFDTQRIGQSAVEYTPSLAGHKIITAANGFLDTAESPAHSGGGGIIDTWLSFYGYAPGDIEWSAAFANTMHRSAGYTPPRDTAVLAQMYNTALSQSVTSRLPYHGCFVMTVTLLGDGVTLDATADSGGAHSVALYAYWHNKPANMAVVIGGDSPDSDETNDIVDYRFINTMTPDPTHPERTTRFVVPTYLRKVRARGLVALPGAEAAASKPLTKRTPSGH